MSSCRSSGSEAARPRRSRSPRSPEVRVAIRLTPRGGADRVDGVRDGKLLARVSAPPVDGAANEALLRLLAEVLGLPRGSVRLVVGLAGREKLVAIAGVDPARVLERWPGLVL